MFDSIRRLGNRINMVLGIGRLTNRVDESRNTPTLQIVLPGGEARDTLPFLQHYGFVSSPEPGADVVSLFQAGDRDRGVVVASNDQRYRPKTLRSGEVALYHKSGTLFLLKNNGSVEVAPSNGKMVITGELSVTGDVKAGNVSLQNHVHSNGYQGKPTGKPQ